MHLRGVLLQSHEDLGCHFGRNAPEHGAAVFAGNEFPFVFSIRVAEGQAHQEPVELRLRQRERADLVGGVLRRDDEKGHRQRARIAVDRYLVFLHRFEQGALRFRRRAIDLVGQDELREDRAGLELELAGVSPEHGDAHDVGGQQVAGELYAPVGQPEYLCQRLGERRLAQTRQILDQQVAAGEQTSERKRDLLILVQDDPAERGAGTLQRLATCVFAGRCLFQRASAVHILLPAWGVSV